MTAAQLLIHCVRRVQTELTDKQLSDPEGYTCHFITSLLARKSNTTKSFREAVELFVQLQEKFVKQKGSYICPKFIHLLVVNDKGTFLSLRREWLSFVIAELERDYV